MNDAKQVASGAIHDVVGAMSSAPLVLGLLLFNLVWLGVLGYFAAQTSDRWERVVEAVLKSCGPVR